jgi:predicted enzyme related to lactoylglutathione lyase
VISRINVVWLYVRDMERSTAFYRDVLGIPLQGDGDWVEATFPDGVRFALHEAHGDVSPGTVNVDFEVADIDDAIGRLRAAGVEVGAITREPFGCFAQFSDPDGYVLELFQPSTK